MMYNRQISLIRAINKNLFLKIFCSLYIFLFLGIVLPAHHHDDGADHDNCAFCIAQNQAPTTETVFSLPIFSGVFVDLPQSTIQNYLPIIFSSFDIRAPPASKLS